MSLRIVVNISENDCEKNGFCCLSLTRGGSICRTFEGRIQISASVFPISYHQCVTTEIFMKIIQASQGGRFLRSHALYTHTSQLLNFKLNRWDEIVVE